MMSSAMAGQAQRARGAYLFGMVALASCVGQQTWRRRRHPTQQFGNGGWKLGQDPSTPIASPLEPRSSRRRWLYWQPHGL